MCGHERFPADWLRLREPVDHRSRAEELLEPLRKLSWDTRSSRILDLGGGTGSNLRYLAPRLPAPQSWVVVDRDAALLQEAQAPGPQVSVRLVEGDLRREGLSEVPGSRLVTGSALLDLVSEEWLRDLVRACAETRAAVHFALTYDGEIVWEEESRVPDGLPGAEGAPGPEDDLLVRHAVNEHQRRDKGMGPALGPDAGPMVERLLEGWGYRVASSRSPWKLGPDDAALAIPLLEGWARAAREVEPGEEERIRRWLTARTDTVVSGRPFSLTVGHRDVTALPGTSP